MTPELFSDAMNEIGAKYVEEALTYKRPAQRSFWSKLAKRAAMVALVALVALLALSGFAAASPAARAAMVETWTGSQVSYEYAGDAPTGELPFVALLDAPSVQEWITASDVSAILVVLIILLGLIFLFATLAAYHQLTACAEAFDGADDAMAAKWRSLCTWQVVIIGCFGAFLTLLLLLGLSSASFFYFYNGGLIVLLLFILAIAIALGVVKIIELVYLNRSAKLYE